MSEPVSFEAGKAMWNVSLQRGLNLSREDILALLQAAEPHIRQGRVTMTTEAGPMHDAGPVDPSQVALTHLVTTALNTHAHSHEGEFENCSRTQCYQARALVQEMDT